jgi:hypothetical protein
MYFCVIFLRLVRGLDEWANARSRSLALSTLKGTVIGVHASHYLDQHLNHHVTKEPLLIALGGFPFALKANIERELLALKSLGVTPIFVFDGLEVGKPALDTPSRARSARALEQAWEFYDQQQAEQVVDAFRSAGMTEIFSKR